MSQPTDRLPRLRTYKASAREVGAGGGRSRGPANRLPDCLYAEHRYPSILYADSRASVNLALFLNDNKCVREPSRSLWGVMMATPREMKAEEGEGEVGEG